MKVVDVELRLDVDFDRTLLEGSVTLTLERVAKDAKKLVRQSRR